MVQRGPGYSLDAHADGNERADDRITVVGPDGRVVRRGVGPAMSGVVVSAGAFALLEVEPGSERELQKALQALPGVVFVERIRGPYQLLAGLGPTEWVGPHDLERMPDVNQATLLQGSEDACACTLATAAG